MNKLSTVLLSLIAIPASAQHIIDPTFPTRPAAPTALNPNAVTNASSRALRWRQGGFYATQPQPPAASYFHICIYDALHGQTCSSTANQWLYAAGDPALQRTPVIPPFNPPPITSAYAYTFQPPANAVPLDRSAVVRCPGDDRDLSAIASGGVRRLRQPVRGGRRDGGGNDRRSRADGEPSGGVSHPHAR